MGGSLAYVSLRDLAGRLLLPATKRPASEQLALPAGLSAGIYLLRVTTAAGEHTVRLAVQ